MCDLFENNMVQYCKYEAHPLPAQHCPLHVWYCLDEPEQVEPPHEGLGLVHDRDLYWLLDVPPHVTGHELHPPYPLHLPCTKNIKIKIPHNQNNFKIQAENHLDRGKTDTPNTP